MNVFGQNFSVQILGESHGECVGILIDGCPAGLHIEPDEFMPDLIRRQGAQQKGTTPRKEPDTPIIKSGVFDQHTSGAPILILFENTNTRSKDYSDLKNRPRPGHADLVAKLKYGSFNDYRGGGHFSGRLTAGLVAAGVIAKKLLAPASFNAKVVSVGGQGNIEQAIDQALNEGDSVGGIVECLIDNISSTLGEPFFDSVESLIAHAAFAIPAVKAVEFGLGTKAAEMRGSLFNDDILDTDGKTASNNSGGINGGITNGNQILVRVSVKPTSSIKKTKRTVDLESGEQVDLSVKGRHDACIALRVPPVLEAVCAIVMADLSLRAQKLARVIKT
jgi:chorismate synthase